MNWDFESFPEYLAARERALGVNLACYIGHSSLRRYVMGAGGSEREATAEEIAEMRGLVREAMAAGAAGFSSSSVPTQVDGDDRPVPSRFASREELVALCEEAGLAGGGSIAYLPKSVIGGLNEEDEELLIELGQTSRLPIVIQGVGGRDKVDAPTAGWENAKRFLDGAAARGAAVFSLLRLARFFVVLQSRLRRLELGRDDGFVCFRLIHAASRDRPRSEQPLQALPLLACEIELHPSFLGGEFERSKVGGCAGRRNNGRHHLAALDVCADYRQPDARP